MTILVAHFTNNEVANQQMRTKVIRAWQRRPQLAAASVKNPQPAYLNGEKTMVFEVDMPRFERAMGLITRGLIFHTKGIRWPGEFIIWSTSMLPSDMESAEQIIATSNDIKKAMEAVFFKTPFLGANPEVFKYQLHISDHPDTRVCARLIFYGGLETVVLSRLLPT